MGNYHNQSELFVNSLLESSIIDGGIKSLLADIVNEDGNISESVLGIYSIMSENNISNENIVKSLSLCQDNEGNFDSRLAQILWDLSLQKADVNEIFDFLGRCKDVEGNINRNITDTLHLFFENGEDKDKVKTFLFE